MKTNQYKYIEAFKKTLADVEEQHLSGATIHCRHRMCKVTDRIYAKLYPIHTKRYPSGFTCKPCPLYGSKLCHSQIFQPPEQTIARLKKGIELLNLLPSEYFTFKHYDQRVFEMVGKKVKQIK